MPAKKRKSPGASRRRVPWALAEGKYLSVRVVSRNAVSAGESVNRVRSALGMSSGPYDGQVAEAVMVAQERLGLPVTGVVTEEDWNAIVNPRRGRRRSGTPTTAGVDGADEGDPSAPLDPPQGSQ